MAANRAGGRSWSSTARHCRLPSTQRSPARSRSRRARRYRTAELQQHRASGLALATAAIALWNTVYLGRALDVLRRHGEAVSDALLAHIAPLGWQHVNLTGDYLWDASSILGPDGFRPLRGGRDALADAA